MQVLLDPSLQEDVVSALRKRAGTGVEFVEVSPGNLHQRDALRRAADEHEHAIVALANGADIPFYEGRRRNFSLLAYTPRGWILEAYPDLIPAAPEEPPQRWLNATQPLIAHRELERAVRNGVRGLHYDSLRNRLAECERRNQTASFPIADVHAWLEEQCGPFTYSIATDRWTAVPHHGLLPLSLEHVRGLTTNTQVWIHEQQLCIVGPNADSVAAWLAPHEPLNANAIVSVFREDLRARNPFSNDEFAAILADARKVGLDLAPALKARRGEFWVGSKTVSLRIARKDAEQLARAFLNEACERDWEFPAASSENTTPLWFRRAVEAPLLELTPRPGCELRLAASLGAGRVLHIDVARFSASTPTPFRLWPREHQEPLQFDGGDVHLWLGTTYDAMLDAESLAPRRSRLAASSDDDYDDDD